MSFTIIYYIGQEIKRDIFKSKGYKSKNKARNRREYDTFGVHMNHWLDYQFQSLSTKWNCNRILKSNKFNSLIRVLEYIGA